MTNAIFTDGTNANTAFDDDCVQATREFVTNLYIIDPNGTYHSYGGEGANAPLVSLEWTDVASPNNGFRVGTFCTNELRVKMTFPDATSGFPVADFGDSIVGCQIYASIESLRDVSGRPSRPVCPLGAFVISNVEVTGDGRDYDITAYTTVDHLYDKFDVSVLSVTYPLKALSLFNAICTYLGLTVDTSALSLADYSVVTNFVIATTVNDVADLPSGTFADYLAWIAGLVGANVRFSRVTQNYPTYIQQTLKIVPYKNVGLLVSRELQYLDGVRKQYDGSVLYTNIVSGTEENPMYGTGRTGNAIICYNPLMTQARLDDLCTSMIGNDGITIIPCDVTWRGNPRMDTCDIVLVRKSDGTNERIYVMEQTLTISGGVQDTFHAYGATEENLTLTSSPYIDKFTQLNQLIEDTNTETLQTVADTYLPLSGGDISGSLSVLGDNVITESGGAITGSLTVNGDSVLTTSGGNITGSLSVNNNAVVTENTSHLQTYTTVTQLGLTIGSATIVDVWNAMPDGSFFMGSAGEFVLTEVPSTLGQVYIGKNSASRQGVWYFPKQLSDGVWVMGADNAGTPDGTWIRLDPYPVGSVVITPTNTNPSATYGGTWTLIDKGFEEFYTTSTTNIFTADTNNVSAVTTFILTREGREIYIRLRVTPSVTVGDTEVIWGTFSLSGLGLSSMYAIWPFGTGDSANGMSLGQLATDGTFSSIDVITKTSGGTIASGNNLTYEMRYSARSSQMLDSVCDKFYWKRTA